MMHVPPRAQRAGRLIGAVAALALLSGAGAVRAQQVDLAGVPYQRRDTRAQTESKMLLAILGQPDVTWGPWHVLSPFDGDEKGTLPIPLPPEEELGLMKAGGAGPDLARAHTGRGGREMRWRDIGLRENAPIDLRTHQPAEYNDHGTAYLYRTIQAEADANLPVTMGSDDGLRAWLNGVLLVDADVPRGLDPEQHRLDLPLRAGVNHLLCKVTQGRGDWSFQLGLPTRLDPEVDARLQSLLSRDFPEPEDLHYPAVTIPVPRGVLLEVGGLDVLPDGRAIACTRRGEVWIVEYADPLEPWDARFTLFAQGLHEPLGLAVRAEGERAAVYCVQRGELTRLVDEDGDDRADVYETVCDAWGVSGNYHEFAFGPKFDAAGTAWITLNVGFCDALGKSVVPYRGWAVTVSPEGSMTPVCDGLRSPNGIGFWRDGTALFLDNQGDYVGTCKLAVLSHDLWHGHPSTLVWREGDARFTPDPPRQPPAVWFPYRRMGQSSADMVLCEQEGRFGPFDGQLFVGDQFSATVMRVHLEEVDGHLQGACFPFRSRLDGGVNRLAFDREGGLLVGQTDRGWGSVGRLRHGIQRIGYSGVTPFEILSVSARGDGFVLTFTRDLERASAADVGSWRIDSYTYLYHARYGSPEVEARSLRVLRGEVIDARRVRLRVEGLRAGGEGFVHEIRAPGVRDATGAPLLHAEAYYTMVRLPTESE